MEANRAELVTEQSSNDIQQLLRQWEDEYQTPAFDPIRLILKMTELIEKETESYMKMDPDPFDDRHPSRVDPNCGLGYALKVVFKKESFMSKLVNDYLRDTYWSRQNIGHPGDARTTDLNIAASRLLLGLLPGLDASAVFQENTSLVSRLFIWMELQTDPLRTYAAGILGAAMEVSSIATEFRESNGRMVPLMLERLRLLQTEYFQSLAVETKAQSNRPFAHFGQTSPRSNFSSPKMDSPGPSVSQQASPVRQPSPQAAEGAGSPLRLVNLREEYSPPGPHSSAMLPGRFDSPGTSARVSDCSNSSWAEMESFVIGSFPMHPVTIATKQILLLRYLTPTGEFQEFLGHIFEHNALEILLQYTNLKESRNARLAFEALKYLAALLLHKKFSFEFINMERLQHLMDIRRPSIAASGVAMCLYHIAYCSDTMERICLSSQHIRHQVVRYALWLLECSHDSSRCHAVMFFILALPFQVILEEFDSQDGLRKVYNVVSTQPLLSSDDNRNLNEDEQCASRQIIRQSFLCFKRYFETHLAIRAETLRRASVREALDRPGVIEQQLQTAYPYKPLRPNQEQVQEYVDTLMQLMSVKAHWAAIENFLDLGGIALLLKVIAFSYEWNYSGRAETVRSALDSVAVCTILPKAQLQLCEKVDLPFDSISMGLNIIIGAAEGEIVNDADVQRSALNVLANCVCPPEQRISGAEGRFKINIASPRKKAIMTTSEEIVAKMWDSVRTNNGIMVLLQLMTVKTRLTEADSIRMLACKALAGLARSETVRQIISRLPLVMDGQLQLLMRDPILQERRQEHVLFQKYAIQLLEKVSGKSGCNEFEASLAHIHKANIVAQTKILYNERQLLLLIQDHLVKKGYIESAKVLAREAYLPKCVPKTPSKPVPASAFPAARNPNITSAAPQPAPCTLATFPSSPVIHHDSNALAGPSTSTNIMPPSSVTVEDRALAVVVGTERNLESSNTPIKLSRLAKSLEIIDLRRRSPSGRILEKQTCFEYNSSLFRLSPPSYVPLQAQTSITLDSIVSEYLKNQHSLCKNPVATCPQFDLFVPHKCHESRDPGKTAINFAMRHPQRQIFPPNGGPDGARLNRRLLHSRFCPVKSFRPTETDTFFTCVAFEPMAQRLMFGTFEGQMKLYNIHSGAELASYQCHDSYIYRMEPSRDGKLLLTSSTWRSPLSALFSLGQFFEMKYPFNDEEYVEFSKVSQNMIIGSKADVANIYDVETGQKTLSLKPEISNNYTKNHATFSPCDELVLSDGVLWDVAANKSIHKFDKLNQTLSGVFHPNGLEVISNTEVWDLRTFHLLRTVPSLKQCELRFTPLADVLYCVSMDADNDEDSTFESSFTTLDAIDYSNIATIDIKRNVYDLAINSRGTQIALVENLGMFESIQESTARIYDIGRKKHEEDEICGNDNDDDDDDQLDDTTNDDDDDDDAEGSSSSNSNTTSSGPMDDSDDSDDSDDDNASVVVLEQAGGGRASSRRTRNSSSSEWDTQSDDSPNSTVPRSGESDADREDLLLG